MVCLLLTLTGCSAPSSQDQPPAAGTAPSVTPSPSPDPAPRVGQCHRLTWDQAVSPVHEGRAVPCRTAHTAQTYYVGSLRLGRLTVDAAPVQERVARACTRRLGAHVGADQRALRLTMVQPIWFTPSLEQVDLGADWFRCDVVALEGHEQLRRLPRQTRGIATDPAVAMCGTAAPGSAGFQRVACARAHQWRAVASIDLPGDRYPAEGAGLDALTNACRDAARDLAQDPLNLRWSQELPTRAQWRAGRTYGLCWMPASR